MCSVQLVEFVNKTLTCTILLPLSLLKKSKVYIVKAPKIIDANTVSQRSHEKGIIGKYNPESSLLSRYNVVNAF